VLLRVVDALNPSNAEVIANGLSTLTRAFDDLPIARNFFAHRNEDTAKKVARVARRLGVPAGSRPSDAVVSRLPTRPQNVLADWIDDVRCCVDLVCQ
jgi:hypothetical protein